MGNCCGNCFEDGYLKGKVDEKSTQKGDCDYCGSKDVPICDTFVMGRIVCDGLLRAYERVGGFLPPREGTNLWTTPYAVILDENVLLGELSFEARRQLIGDLISDGRSPSDLELTLDSQLMSRVPPDPTWDAFKYDVKYYSRFFRGIDLQSSDSFLAKMGRMLGSFETPLGQGSRIYRARVTNTRDLEATTLDDVGPPPPENTRNNRMSPAGISYLYASSSKELCVAEVGPHAGSKVYVGRMTVTRPLRLLDLTRLSSLFDPNASLDLLYRGFLRDFLRDISKPVLSEDSVLEYLPTQVFSEFVRDQKYDGICYPGVRARGVNYAFFCGSRHAMGDLHTPMRVLPPFTDWFTVTNIALYRILSADYCLSEAGCMEFGDSLVSWIQGE